MKRKLLVALAAVAMLATVPGIASAESAGGTSTLDVSVPVSITFAFTAGQAVHFGSVAAGTSKTLSNAIQWSVSTNNENGFSLSWTPGVAPGGGVAFSVMDHAGGGFYPLDTPGAVSWGGNGGAGTMTGGLDARVTIGAASLAGDYSQDLTFLAVTS